MAQQLQGKNILVITSNAGVERDELLKPLEELRSQGATLVHGSIKGGTVQTFLHDTEKDRTVESDARLKDLHEADFHALVIPGGTVNADTLRTDEDARRLIKEFSLAGKVVAAICHGPWALIDAGVAEGKTLTSYPSLQIDLANAGAEWVDKEVQKCGAKDWTLITSRKPDDIPAFNRAIGEALVA